MSRFARNLVLALLLAVTSAVSAAAGELDFDSFDRTVARLADTPPRGPKDLCLCLDSGELRHLFGFLVRASSFSGSWRSIRAGCAVPRFLSNGSLISLDTCQSFSVVAK